MDVGQEDISQAFALASIWILFLAVGCSACLVPIFYTIGLAYQDAFPSGFSHVAQAPALGFLATVNGILFMVVGSLIGYPIASSSGEFTYPFVGYITFYEILQYVWSCIFFK